MMLVPRSNFDLFDDFFRDDFFKGNRKENNLMKTNIKEKKDKYELEVDLPGYEKENISLKLDNGYLTVTAETSNEVNEGDEESNYVHREKFYGTCSRNFYVGDTITEEDINASFKNGVLKIDLPKKEEEIKESKTIEIK